MGQPQRNWDFVCQVELGLDSFLGHHPLEEGQRQVNKILAFV